MLIINKVWKVKTERNLLTLNIDSQMNWWFLFDLLQVNALYYKWILYIINERGKTKVNLVLWFLKSIILVVINYLWSESQMFRALLWPLKVIFAFNGSNSYRFQHQQHQSIENLSNRNTMSYLNVKISFQWCTHGLSMLDVKCMN